MRKNFGPQNWLYPMPVLMIGTYDENGVPDVMNAAWGGIHDTNQIGICIDPGHKSAKNLQFRKCFTVSIGCAAQVSVCDYTGLVSANAVPDKVKRAGLTPVKSEFVEAPLFEEFPMALECRLLSYDTIHGCATGEILNVSADPAILDAAGKIDPEKLDPIVFDPVHNVYRKLGAAIAPAFQIGRKL